MMNINEDVILLGRKAKDETEDFINRHFENQTKGWPKVRLYDYACKEQYREENAGSQKSY
jgi:hypothetical protein